MLSPSRNHPWRGCRSSSGPQEPSEEFQAETSPVTWPFLKKTPIGPPAFVLEACHGFFCCLGGSRQSMGSRSLKKFLEYLGGESGVFNEILLLYNGRSNSVVFVHHLWGTLLRPKRFVVKTPAS